MIVWTTPSEPVNLAVDETAHKATYKSGGVDISGYFYKPQGTGPFPAVMVVHGSAGLSTSHRDRAIWLAANGYVAFAPDHFTPTGMTQEKFNTDRAGYVREIVPTVRVMLGNGLEALKSLAYVDRNRLGVMGFSLGGTFSDALATRDDVKGSVDFYGSASLYLPQVKAPMLLFHGTADQDVPFSTFEAKRDILTAQGKQFEYYVYEGAGHGFDLPGWKYYDARAAADANEKTLAFLKAKLR